MDFESIDEVIAALEAEVAQINELIESYELEEEAVANIEQSTRGLLAELDMAAEEAGIDISK